MKSYDVVVIGSGAGLNVLNACISKGSNCALVESSKIGGTCLTTGCIPSKILVYPATLIREAEHAKRVGLEFKYETDWNLIQERMWTKINESQTIEKNLGYIPTLDVYRGVAEFVSDYTLHVKLNSGERSEEFKGEKIVIASGARPLIPRIPGLEETGYVTSDSFFGDKFPSKPWNSLIMIGGGVIAVEFAHILSAFGTKVKIIEMKPKLVSTEEPVISDFLEANMKQQMEVYTNKKAVSTRLQDKDKIVTIEDTIKGEKAEIHGEEIFVASGRRSNADLLNVAKTGVEMDNFGWVKTDDYLETTKKNIWCIGDANGGIQLRHRANYDAEICINNMFGLPEDRRVKDYTATPSAVYTYPEIGHVGMTEQEALNAGYQIYVAVKHYSSVANGYAMGLNPNDVDDGFVKLIVAKDLKILGAHIVGPHASLLVQPFVYLMNAGYTCEVTEETEKGRIEQTSHPGPESGTFAPIINSMIIHPSLNEVAAWAIGSLKPVNIKED
jgi:mycothione reductase